MNQGATEFRSMLAWNHDLASDLDSSGFPQMEFDMLQHWQRRRIRHSYADFIARESDAPACRFFLQKLYGGMNFRERDHEISQVASVMTRMLPQKALHATAEALHLQGISLELDIEMAGLLQLHGIRKIQINVYAQTYRECGRRLAREKQILLIRNLGHELEELVAMPLLLRLVRLMRGPAIVAGFGQLQAFLEEGIFSFGQLEDAAAFVEAIYQREWRTMLHLFNADSSKPRSRPKFLR